MPLLFRTEKVFEPLGLGGCEQEFLRQLSTATAAKLVAAGVNDGFAVGTAKLGSLGGQIPRDRKAAVSRFVPNGNGLSEQIRFLRGHDSQFPACCTHTCVLKNVDRFFSIYRS